MSIAKTTSLNLEKKFNNCLEQQFVKMHFSQFYPPFSWEVIIFAHFSRFFHDLRPLFRFSEVTFSDIFGQICFIVPFLLVFLHHFYKPLKVEIKIIMLFQVFYRKTPFVKMRFTILYSMKIDFKYKRSRFFKIDDSQRNVQISISTHNSRKANKSAVKL